MSQLFYFFIVISVVVISHVSIKEAKTLEEERNVEGHRDTKLSVEKVQARPKFE